MNAQSNASSMPGALLPAMPQAMHATNATQLTGRFQDQGEKTQLPDAAGAVDNRSSAAWFDQELTDSEARVYLARTRSLLEKMQAEQEALARELDESGVTGFVARDEWLIAHRSPLEVLAAEIRAAKVAGWHPSHGSLAAPKRSHKARTFTDRQMEIAIAAMARQENAA